MCSGEPGRQTYRKMVPTVASCRGHTGTFETQDRVGNCGMRKEGVRRDLTEGVIISPIQGENSVFPPREPVALPVVTTEAGNLASLSHLHFNLNISLSRVNGYSNFVIFK